LRRAGFNDIRTTFEVEVAPAAGEAKSLQPLYTLSNAARMFVILMNRSAGIRRFSFKQPLFTIPTFQPQEA